MAEHLHQLDLCPECDGLRVLTATRLEGMTLHLDACPNTTPEVNLG